ncbi:hypothetical protein ACB094_05G022300 [Castanea mollissima]
MVLNSQTMDVSMTKLDYYEDKLKLHSNATLLSYIKIKHLVATAIVLKGLGVLFIFGISLGAKQGSN